MIQDTFLLVLETSTKNCSVALLKNGAVLDSEDFIDDNYSHAEKLHVFIQDILSRNNLKPSQLSALAVSEGPGSYTGLRIGVSSAKGIAYACKLPLIAFSCLKSLAAEAKEATGWDKNFLCLIDARRMEAFSLRLDSNMQEISKVEAVVYEDNLEPQKDYLVCGDAHDKLQTNYPDIFSYWSQTYPKARFAANEVWDKFNQSNFEDLAYFEPFYLKNFVAIKPKKPFS